MIQYTHILARMDLAKNEATIYETLLRNGSLSASSISAHSKIHRRNVYDSLNRLREKGFVLEIVERKENIYKAVDPRKLMEHVKEKESALTKIMPHLEHLYKSVPLKETVYIYKGVEGWKNYLSDVLAAEKDLYTIGGKGAWGDSRLEQFLTQFLKKARSKKINFYTLYEGDKTSVPSEVLNSSKKYKFLPKGFSSTSSIEVFGDHTAIIPNIVNGRIDEDASLTVVINKCVADTFRAYFDFIWALI